METFGEIGLYVSYVLVALALLGLFVGIGIAVMQNWKDGGMYAVVGIVAIIVFYGIGYVLSSDDISERLILKGLGDPVSYMRSSAGIIAVYIMAIVASILLVVDVVKGFMDGN
jgi:hypothetical protein